MALYVVGHGQYSGSPVTVPIGSKYHVYAVADTYLSQYVGMKLISAERDWKAQGIYSSETEPAMPNYELNPLTSEEAQRFRTVYSEEMKIKFVGDGLAAGKLCSGGVCAGAKHTCKAKFDLPFTEGEACSQPRCWDGRHHCDGLFTKMDDVDVHLVCCAIPTALAGASTAKLTKTVKDRDNRDMDVGHDETAQRADGFAARLADPETSQATMAELRLMERRQPGAVAEMLATSPELRKQTHIVSAREQLRAGMSPGAFVHWLAGVPDELRDAVVSALRENGDLPQAAADPADPVQGLLRRFPGESHEQRGASWHSLSAESQSRLLADNWHVADWVARFLPVVDALVDAAVRDDLAAQWNVYAWFEGVPSGLSQAELTSLAQCQAYGTILSKVAQFAELSRGEKSAVWDGLSEAARASVVAHFKYQHDAPPEAADSVSHGEERDVHEPVMTTDSDSDDEDSYADDGLTEPVEQNREILQTALSAVEKMPVYVYLNGSAVAFGIESVGGGQEYFTVEAVGLDDCVVTRYASMVDEPELTAALAAACPGYVFTVNQGA